MPLDSVLIVRLSAIGDVVHALPVAEALRRALPQARIGWLVEELAAPLLDNHPDIDRVYTLPKKQWRRGPFRAVLRDMGPFFRRIRGDRWDAVVDLQGILKSALAARACASGAVVGFAGENAREGSRFLYGRGVRPRAGDIHVVEQNLRLLEGLGLGVPDSPPRGRLGLREDEVREMRGKLAASGWAGERLLAINPGAGWRTKRWAPARYAALARRLVDRIDGRAMVLWGPGEENLREAVLGPLRGRGAFAAPLTSVREMAVLLSLCSGYLGGDTGPSQIAGLFGIPVLTIWGASDPARNRPWTGTKQEEDGRTLQRRDLACVPCWKRRCPLAGEARLACLRGLPPDAMAGEDLDWFVRRWREPVA